MDVTKALIPILVYFVPILFFMYMGIDVLLRNSRRVEHWLLCLIITCYILLFLEEYVRHQLDISYSPILTGLWFSNVGVLIPGLGFHFLAKLAHMDKLMPRYLYPYVFYLPILVVVVNIFSSERVISANQFVQSGIWKMPVYNTQYYITLTVGILISLLYLIPLFIGKKTANTHEHNSIYNLMVWGVVLVIGWHVVFGYFQNKDFLPPYPYLYAGAIWCFILRLTMIRYDFLNFIDRRYEKLFNLNPSAILLVDLQGRVKEANPGARKLFQSVRLDRIQFLSLFQPEVREHMYRRDEIKDLETKITIGESKRLDVLMDGDYVYVDNEPHIILILRDITVQKENQQEIKFLAYHDPLTRLPNRRFFYEQLEQALIEARELEECLAVILIDLDRFKEMNDHYGHKAGDEVLQFAAVIIQETAEAHNGMAARLGGDEFVLFVNRIPSASFVQQLIQQLQHRFSVEQLTYEGERLPVQMSIGASCFPQDGTEVSTLMNSADKAMYEVKRANRASYANTTSDTNTANYANTTSHTNTVSVPSDESVT